MTGGGRLALLLRFGVSIAVAAFVLRKMEWPVLGRQFASADPLWLLVGLLASGIPIVLITVRWQFLLRTQQLRPSFSRLLGITFIGYFFNAFLLGSTGGDLMKAWYVARETPEARTRAAFSILIDRVIGLTMLASAGLAGVLWQWPRFAARADLQRIPLVLGAPLLLVAATVAAVVWLPPRRLPQRFQPGLTAARQYLAAWPQTVAAAAITVPVHLVSFYAGFAIAQALHLNVTYAEICVVLAVMFFAISVPVSVSGHGVREGILLLLFQLFAIGETARREEASVAFSLLYFALNFVWSLLGGLVYLGFRHRDEQAPAAASA